MNRDLKGRWDQLRSELHHWNSRRADDLEWIDATHDYTRGRVAVQHVPRERARERSTEGTAARRN